MITTTGQSIIAKYLVDQAPAYASYIAVGCGAKPRAAYSDSVTSYSITNNLATVSANAHPFLAGDLITISSNVTAIDGTYTITSATADEFSFAKTTANVASTNINGTAILNFKNKEVLDFEMFRIPITSRTFEQSGGITNVILSGDLPSQDRYYITEAGVFSAGSNPVASGIDSRILNTFTTAENWEYHNLSTAVSISTPTSVIYYTANGVIDKSVTGIAFNVENTNAIFVDNSRSSLTEQPRMFQSSIVVSSGLSIINRSSATWSATGQPHLHLIGRKYPFDRNASSDELKLAVSLMSVSPSATVPDNTYIMIEFSSDETETGTANDYARAQFDITKNDFIGDNRTSSPIYENRYAVKTVSLGELKKSSGFNWAAVDIIKVYASVPAANLSVTNKALTSNVATLTLNATPTVITGQVFTVSGVDSTFNGTYQVESVNTVANTVSYALVANNVSSTAASGTFQYSDSSYYIALDGLRFENNRDRENNPIYGMVAYSPVQDSVTADPVLKEVNSANIFEVKFNLELDVEA